MLSINDVTLRGGRRVHDIVTMCDVGGKREVDHVILHVSWLDNFHNKDNFYISEL